MHTIDKVSCIHQALNQGPHYPESELSMSLFRQKWFFLIAITIAIVAYLCVVSMRRTRLEETAVLVPVNLFEQGLSQRNGSEIEASAITGATFVSMQYGTLEQMTLQQIADRIGTGTTHVVETLHHPVVRIDHDLAEVWAPFEFTIDGKLDHCGTDSFSLVRNNGKWLIGSLSATLRKECGTP